jgi:iron complex outermembrane recepter protein
MKKLFLGICMILALQYSFAQSQARGKVIDEQSLAPLPAVTVEALSVATKTTNDNGFFEFSKVPAGIIRFKFSCVGYRPLDTAVRFPGAGLILIGLQRINLFMQPIEVKALRAGDLAPFTKTNISKKEIEQTNLGQDLPFLLNQTPSVVINSDAGNGVGYTAIYIRGTDDSRINMTLNGIPYNDAEEQAIYFVDLPDLASSVNSIQIERGVGTSSNGAGAFGATINFSTNEFNEKAYAELNNSWGSFDTWKNTVKVGSGLIDGHFTLDARLSRITSDGFIDRATSDLKSFFLSAAYYNANTSVRFNIISGTEKTYQAWNGIPEAKVDGNMPALEQHYQDNKGSLYFTSQDSINLFTANDRRYNYFTYKNQTDNYQQDHYQLFVNHQFSQQLSFNAALFLTHGAGYYEEYHDSADLANASYAAYGLPNYVVGNDTLLSTDLIRQRWLNNYFYGGIFSFQYKKNATQLTLGGGWDRYDGGHYGLVTWSKDGGIPNDYQYYSEPAYKTDFNIYGKWQQQFSAHWTGFADLQYRHLHYQIDGFDDNPTLFVDNLYDFLNPKLGVTYASNQWQASLSYSIASHEPNRDDYETGLNEQPKPEMLQDAELNVLRKGSWYSWGATLYYMRYHDQLVLTGQINDVGEYTRTNIPDSYRLGIEMQASVRPLSWFSAEVNLALSQNKVFNYTEYDDNYDSGGQLIIHYNKTDIAFSPAAVGAATLNFFTWKNIELSLLSKYVSQEYLDNAQLQSRSLHGYYLQNARLIFPFQVKPIKDAELIIQVNNLFNEKYEPNGYTYSYVLGGQLVTENFLFPMAGTNFMVAINLKL